MKLLDLFCGAGGAAMGYYRAGFDDITGVDIKPMPRYPFRFVQGDALEYLDAHGHEFDTIHASPPCQAYSRIRHMTRGKYPDLIAKTRYLLKITGKPYVIENVEGAPLVNAIRLCGTSFGLWALIRGKEYELRRHRLFEVYPELLFAPQCHHTRPVVGIYGHGEGSAMRKKRGFQTSSMPVRREIMEMDWGNQNEISQAIPPVYTEWIGKQLIKQIKSNQGIQPTWMVEYL